MMETAFSHKLFLVRKGC